MVAEQVTIYGSILDALLNGDSIKQISEYFCFKVNRVPEVLAVVVNESKNTCWYGFARMNWRKVTRQT